MSVTRRIQKEISGLDTSSPDVWQRNYYEHIIRNDLAYNRIHAYIEANVRNWHRDEEYPAQGA
jgi:REP element-mobilizing transposase RayT